MPITITDIPTTEPREFVAGTTLVWKKSLPDFPATDWTLNYYFRGPGAGFDVLAVADGTGFKATVIAADTAKCAPGGYYWQSFVTKGAEVYQVDEGRTTCKRSLAGAAAAAYDGRSETKQTLDAIRAAMGRVATQAQLQRTIGDKHIQFMTMADLIIAETRFQQLYNQEARNARIKEGAPFLKNVHTRFVRPS